MDRLGIKPKKKQRFREGKFRTVVDLYYDDVAKALQKEYGKFDMPIWATEDSVVCKEIQDELNLIVGGPSTIEFDVEVKEDSYGSGPMDKYTS